NRLRRPGYTRDPLRGLFRPRAVGDRPNEREGEEEGDAGGAAGLSLLRPLLASIWMGWQREIGWGNPVVAILARSVAPAAGALTAEIVYWFGASAAGLFDPGRLAYVVVGASLYGQVALYAYVPTSAISEGKNSYVFPQVFMTPSSSIPYLTGRCVASFLESVPVVVISVAVCALVSSEFFHATLPLIVSPLSVALFVTAMALI